MKILTIGFVAMTILFSQLSLAETEIRICDPQSPHSCE